MGDLAPVTVVKLDVGHEPDMVAGREPGLGGVNPGEIRKRPVAVDVHTAKEDAPVLRLASRRIQKLMRHHRAIAACVGTEEENDRRAARKRQGPQAAQIHGPWQGKRQTRCARKQDESRHHLRQRHQPSTITPLESH